MAGAHAPRAPDDLASLEELARFVAGLRSEDVPVEVADHANAIVLDGLGCGIHGSTAPWAQKIHAGLLRANGANGDAVVWGTSQRTGPAAAAACNGVSVHAYEYDDVGAHQHNASVVLTAALAVHRLRATSARMADLTAAFVAGCETAARFTGLLGRRSHVELGFHGPSISGTFGATAAAAHILGLDERRVVEALCFAAQQASGLMATQHGGDGKRLVAGAAASVGVQAVFLAEQGVVSNPFVIAGGYGGFASALNGGDESHGGGLPALAEGLGTTWRTVESRIKHWAARSPIHSPVEALRALRATNGFVTRDVAAVHVGLDEGAYRAVAFPLADVTPTSASLNLQFCLAHFLIHGSLFPDAFGPACLDDAHVMDLAARVTAHHDPAMPARGYPHRTAVVRVVLADGTVLEAVGRSAGSTGEPIDEAILRGKFVQSFAARGLDDRAVRVSEIVREDGVALLCELEDLLSTP